MAEYIRRDTVLRCIKESRDGINWGQSEDGDAFLHYSACLYRTIASAECIHAADVRPVVRGKWEERKTFFHNSIVKCSLCGNFLDLAGVNAGRGDANFCPNCGADMREES